VTAHRTALTRSQGQLAVAGSLAVFTWKNADNWLASVLRLLWLGISWLGILAGDWNRLLATHRRTSIFGGMMRKFAVFAFTAIVLSGCAASSERDRNILTGITVGAGVGALIGSAAGGPPGTWIGAAAGGAAGGAIGYLIRPEGCFMYNKKGELWQVPCSDQLAMAPGCYVGNEIIGLQPVSCPRRTKRAPAPRAEEDGA